jgi:hypothetical protein
VYHCLEAEGEPLVVEAGLEGEHLGLGVDDLEVHALGDLEVEGDA